MPHQQGITVRTISVLGNAFVTVTGVTSRPWFAEAMNIIALVGIPPPVSQ
jgi:hypothetical protein